MNKLSLLTLTAVLSLSANHNLAMQPEAKVKAQGETVTLISLDNKEFVIPKNVAEQSLFIKAALASGMKEAKEGIIRFQEQAGDVVKLSGNVVELVAKLLKVSAQAANEKELIALTTDTLENYDISYDAMKDILQTVDFLDIQKLEIPLIHYTVTKFFKATTKNTIETKIKNDFPKSLQGLLAKYSFLIYGHDFIYAQSIKEYDSFFINVEDDYGFSIQELIDYKKLTETKKILNITFLNLSGSKINSLIGLKNIPNFATLQELDLSGNEIKTIDPNAFSGFTSLSKLNLSNNKLTTISPNTFSVLNNLQTLNLSNNKLTTIYPNIFSGLNKLQILDLSNNKLTTIDPNIFSGLNNLQILDLSFNSLSESSKRALLQSSHGTKAKVFFEKII